MAREASGRFAFVTNILETATLLGVGDGTARYQHVLDFSVDLANGTSDGAFIDRVHSLNGSTTAGVPTDIDVSGALASVLNSATNVFVDLTLLVIKNTTAAGGGSVVLGADAASVPLFLAANDAINIHPGGAMTWYSPTGLAIVAATSDILQIAASAGTVTWQLILAGRSA